MDVMMFRVVGLEGSRWSQGADAAQWFELGIHGWAMAQVEAGFGMGKNWDVLGTMISDDMKWYQMRWNDMKWWWMDWIWLKDGIDCLVGRKCRRSGDVVCLQDSGHVHRNVKSLQSTALVVSPSTSHSVWVPRKCISSCNWWHRDSCGFYILDGESTVNLGFIHGDLLSWDIARWFGLDGRVVGESSCCKTLYSTDLCAALPSITYSYLHWESGTGVGMLSLN